MDYSSFYPQNGQPFNYMELPPQDSGFSGTDNKMPVVATDALDGSLFPASFDAFRFDNPLLATQDLGAPLALAIDTAVGPTDGIGDMISPIPSQTQQSIPQQSSVPNQQLQDSDGNLSRGIRRGSSEEKELTPAQSRRKAQNRAAQRAFRERKERHVKELEAKLTALESSATSLASDNERLRLALQRATTEVEILRSNRLSLSGPSGSPRADGDDASSHAGDSVGDAKESRKPSIAQQGDAQGATDGSSAAGLWKTNSRDSLASLSKKISATSSTGQTPPLASGQASAVSANSSITSTTQPASLARGGDERLIPAGAVWDLIQAHPLVRNGTVDIADVCERLRGAARCDGLGPVFAAGDIRRAVEGSRRGGGDELI